jgi:WD40 repeat protein
MRERIARVLSNLTGAWLAAAGLGPLQADPPTPRPALNAARGEGFMAVRFSPDGKTLAATAANSAGSSRLVLFDLATGKATAEFKSAAGERFDSVAFSPDGTAVAVGGIIFDGKRQSTRVARWEVATGKAQPDLTSDDGDTYISIAYSPDGKAVAGAGQRRTTTGEIAGQVTVWDAATAKRSAALHGDLGEFMSVAFSPDGKAVVAAGGTRLKGAEAAAVVRHWEVATGTPMAPLAAPPLNYFWSVAYRPDGKAVAALGGRFGDKNEVGARIAVWDPATGKAVGPELKVADGERFSTLAFSPDGKAVAAAGPGADAGMVAIWDVATGDRKANLRAGPGSTYIMSVYPLAFSPDGKTVAAGVSILTLLDAETPMGKK